MNKKTVFLAFLAIIALASFFRLWEIKSIPPGFYPDEAMNGNNANEAWQTKDFKLFYPENNGREGLWINMMAPLLAVFGNEPWVPRTMAAIFGILTVLGLYFLAKTTFPLEPNGALGKFFPRGFVLAHNSFKNQFPGDNVSVFSGLEFLFFVAGNSGKSRRRKIGFFATNFLLSFRRPAFRPRLSYVYRLPNRALAFDYPFYFDVAERTRKKSL